MPTNYHKYLVVKSGQLSIKNIYDNSWVIHDNSCENQKTKINF